MEKQYLLSVDQSTQGTKALLFDQEGNLICRGDRPHRQPPKPVRGIDGDFLI